MRSNLSVGNLACSIRGRERSPWMFEGRVRMLRVLDAAIDIASSIDFLHRQKLVHGDIKPENILLQANSDGTQAVKVCDLGSLKRYRDYFDPKRLNYTPRYVAPEIADLRNSLSSFTQPLRLPAASDVFAFGNMLAEFCNQQLLRPGPDERLMRDAKGRFAEADKLRAQGHETEAALAHEQGGELQRRAAEQAALSIPMCAPILQCNVHTSKSNVRRAN